MVSEVLDSDDIGVTLDWTHENQSLYSYSVSITPNALSQTLSESTTIQLVASYDTVHNVSILATSQCGQRIVTTLIELYYGK